MDTITFCKRLPKIELHAHLNGSLSQSALKKLQELSKDCSPEWNYLIENGDTTTLDEVFMLFNLAHALTGKASAVRLAALCVIEEFASDGVVYLELRTTPRAVPDVMTKDDYLEAVIGAIEESKKSTPSIIVKLIISVDRRKSEVDNEDSLQIAIDFKRKYPSIVCGMDLSGDPAQGMFNEDLFRRARNNGLKITLHCAEVPAEAEVTRMLDFHPDRLGHGTCIHPSYKGTESQWQKLLESKIPIECCLTSNIKTRTTEVYSDHHFKFLYQMNHPVTISTDDRGVFNTELSKELQICATTFQLTNDQLWELTYKSIDYSFASEEEKNDLKNTLMNWKESARI